MSHSIGSGGGDEGCGRTGLGGGRRGRRQGEVCGETRDKARCPGIGAVVPYESLCRLDKARVGEGVSPPPIKDQFVVGREVATHGPDQGVDQVR